MVAYIEVVAAVEVEGAGTKENSSGNLYGKDQTLQ